MLKKSPDQVQVEERPSRAFVGLDRHGIEFPDSTPVEVPTRLRMPQRQVDRVREIIRQEMSRQAAAEELETFEEADDFELPDVEAFSPYEENFEPVVLSRSPANGGGKEKVDEDRSLGGRTKVDPGGDGRVSSDVAAASRKGADGGSGALPDVDPGAPGDKGKAR